MTTLSTFTMAFTRQYICASTPSKRACRVYVRACVCVCQCLQNQFKLPLQFLFDTDAPSDFVYCFHGPFYTSFGELCAPSRSLETVHFSILYIFFFGVTIYLDFSTFFLFTSSISIVIKIYSALILIFKTEISITVTSYLHVSLF